MASGRDRLETWPHGRVACLVYLGIVVVIVISLLCVYVHSLFPRATALER